MIGKGKGFAQAIRKLEGKHTEPDVDHAIHRGYYRDNLPNGGRVRFLKSGSDICNLYLADQEREVGFGPSGSVVDSRSLNGNDAVYVILRRD